MATKTDVANKALRKLYIPSISDIDDTTSEEAVQCKAEIDSVRRQFLGEAAPGFARREKALALASGESSEMYDYAYAYPSDCLKTRHIYNPAGLDADPIEYETGAHSSGTSELILASQEDAVLVYTIDITNYNMFRDDDIDAVALLLAHRVAILKRDSARARELLVEYTLQLSTAKKNNKRDQRTELRSNTRYSDARK